MPAIIADYAVACIARGRTRRLRSSEVCTQKVEPTLAVVGDVPAHRQIVAFAISARSDKTCRRLRKLVL